MEEQRRQPGCPALKSLYNDADRPLARLRRLEQLDAAHVGTQRCRDWTVPSFR